MILLGNTYRLQNACMLQIIHTIPLFPCTHTSISFQKKKTTSRNLQNYAIPGLEPDISGADTTENDGERKYVLISCNQSKWTYDPNVVQPQVAGTKPHAPNNPNSTEPYPYALLLVQLLRCITSHNTALIYTNDPSAHSRSQRRKGQ